MEKNQIALNDYVKKGKFYKSVVEDGSDIIFIVDYSGRIKYHNPAVEENLGYAADTLIEKDFFNFIHPDIREDFEQKFKLSTTKPFDENIEFHFLCEDGNYRYLEYNSINIKNKEGLEGLILDCRDITQLKRNAEELIRAQKAKELFLANMSHEIRTPINGISGMVELMEGAETTEERQNYLEAIKKSSESLKVIINDILDLSIIESGKLQLEKLAFDLSSHMNSLKSTFLHQAQNKGLQFNVDISENAQVIVKGDPVRLDQILFNLINNALKFTHQGSVQVLVELKEETDQEYIIQFTVKDSGIGISEDKKQRVFESFTQADESITRQYGGTGLGLAITRQLVDLLRGEITVSSQVNVGTTFTFTLPFEKGQFISEKSEEDQFNSNTSSFDNLSVLIVEDNEINRLYVSTILRKWSINVIEAENGVAAVEKFSKNEVQLILMDLQMPVMDGFEATKIIRNKFKGDKKGVPIIALTANVVKGDQEKCFEVGMDDYLSKPFRPKELFAIIKNYCGDIIDYDSIESAPIETSNKQRVTNLEYLQNLCDGDEKFMDEMKQVFKDTIPASIEQMKELNQQKKFLELSKIAHKLKPSFTFVGINEGLEISKYIELVAKENPTDKSITKKIKRLEDLVNKAILELEED